MTDNEERLYNALKALMSDVYHVCGNLITPLSNFPALKGAEEITREAETWTEWQR